MLYFDAVNWLIAAIYRVHHSRHPLVVVCTCIRAGRPDAQLHRWLSEGCALREKAQLRTRWMRTSVCYAATTLRQLLTR